MRNKKRYGDIYIAMEITDFFKIVPNLNSFFKNVVSWLLSILNRLFIHSKVLVSIPDELSTANTNQIAISKILKFFRETGIAEDFNINPYNFPDEPMLFNAQVGQHGSGSNFLSLENAIWSALGENLERSLWLESDEFYKNKVIYSTYNKLKNRAIDPLSISGFSEEQRHNNKKLSFDGNSKLAWIRAKSLTQGRKVYCPLQLFSAHYFNNSVNEPMLRWPITTGLATGPTLNDALVTGILEIIERDAFMISYLNKLEPPRLVLKNIGKKDAQIAHIGRMLERYHLDTHLLLLPTDYSVYVILAVVIDRTTGGPKITVGAKAGFDPKLCILGYISEAISVRNYIKNSYRDEIDVKEKGREWRLRYWAQQKDTELLSFFLRGKTINDLPTTNVFSSAKNRLKFLVEETRRIGEDIYYTELTTKKFRKLNMHSVCVLMPTLQPMHLDESIPYFGGSRLHSVPVQMGYKSAKNLNTTPHPFP